MARANCPHCGHMMAGPEGSDGCPKCDQAFSPYAQKSRAIKALKLVSAIDRLASGQGIDPHGTIGLLRVLAAMHDWTPAHWALVAEAAECNVPSAITRAVVAKHYGERSVSLAKKKAS